MVLLWHVQAILTMVVSCDGYHLATASNNHSCRIWASADIGLLWGSMSNAQRCVVQNSSSRLRSALDTLCDRVFCVHRPHLGYAHRAQHHGLARACAGHSHNGLLQRWLSPSNWQRGPQLQNLGLAEARMCVHVTRPQVTLSTGDFKQCHADGYKLNHAKSICHIGDG